MSLQGHNNNVASFGAGVHNDSLRDTSRTRYLSAPSRPTYSVGPSSTVGFPDVGRSIQRIGKNSLMKRVAIAIPREPHESRFTSASRIPFGSHSEGARRIILLGADLVVGSGGSAHRTVVALDDLQQKLRFRLQIAETGHNDGVVQVAQYILEGNIFQARGVVPMGSHQNVDDSVDMNVASNEIFANRLQAIQQKLFTGNEQLDPRFERDVFDCVRVQVLQDLEKYTVRHFWQEDWFAPLRPLRPPHLALSHATAQHGVEEFGTDGQHSSMCVHVLPFHQEMHIGQIRIVDELAEIVDEGRGRHRNGLQTKLVEVVQDVGPVVATKDVQACRGTQYNCLLQGNRVFVRIKSL